MAEYERIQQHPDYHEGFFDAQTGAPLHDDCSDPYKAGWQAYWNCRAILERNDFEETAPGQFSKTVTLGG